MLNEHRKNVSDSEAKEIIDRRLPDLHRDLEEYEEMWGDLVEAGSAKSISHAMAICADRDPEIVLDIHRINPWKPMPEEATLLKAFGPNLIAAVLLTFDSPVVDDLKDVDGSLRDDLVKHTEKMLNEICERSKRELDATRRKA